MVDRGGGLVTSAGPGSSNEMDARGVFQVGAAPIPLDGQRGPAPVKRGRTHVRSSLVIAAMALVVATPLTAQSKARPRVHREPHRRTVQRVRPRTAPRSRATRPVQRRAEPGHRAAPRPRQATPRPAPRRAAPAPRTRDREDRYGRSGDRDRRYERDRPWDRDRSGYAGREDVRRYDRDRYRNRDDRYGRRNRDDRYRLARPYQHGRFRLLGPRYRYPVVRIEIGSRRVWLGGGFSFEIAAWDWPYAEPWCWRCDQFAIYVDPYHPGWYLLWDLRLGRSVHVRYLGR